MAPPHTLVQLSLSILFALGAAATTRPQNSSSSTSTSAISDLTKEISSSYGKCTESLVTVNITANNTIINLDPPKDQDVLTDFIVQLSTPGSTFLQDITGGPVINRRSYKVNTILCVPKTQDDRGTVQIAVHGGGFDHTYWTLGGSGSKYNYAEAALKAGHAVLLYDRLGTGKSDKPHGIQEAQTATHIEVAAELVKYLKANPHGHAFRRFVGIGHSYGSMTLVGLLNKYGNVLDAAVVTGITSYKASLLTSIATWSISVPALNNPKRFGSLSPGYFIWNNIINNQQNFFKYPNYDPKVLQLTEDTKVPAALGELLSGLNTQPSSLYTNPVLDVTGENDYIVCGGNCLQTTTGANGTVMNLVEATKEVFPGVTRFDTYVPRKTGHGLVAHLNAPEIYAHILDWIKGL